MKYLIFSCILLSATTTFGQEFSAQDSIYIIEQLDIEPVFEGGMEKFPLFLQKNLNYPKKSRKKRIEGYIFIQFVIEKNGDVTNIKILQHLDEYCDAEAKRVIGLMPKWTPGQKNGRNVRTYFNLPLKFSLTK